jgi:hypothetical protein
VALPVGDEPHALRVEVSADDVTIVLALLSFFGVDREPDDPLLEIAGRVTERLRVALVALQLPPRGPSS